MKYLLGILLFILYSTVYIALAVDSTGAGHGTFVFFAPLATWFLILVAAIMILRTITNLNAVLIPTLLLTHYVVTATIVLSYLMESTELLIRRWEMSSAFVVFTVTWYLLGQALIWVTYAVKRRAANSPV